MSPARLDWRAAGTLAGLFAARVAASPDKTAYLEWHEGRWRAWSWSEVAGRVGRFQAALTGTGITPGERVAVMLPNGLDWVCMDQAAAACGAVVVPIFANDRPDSAAWLLNHSGARLLLTRSLQWRGICAAGAPPTLARVVLTDGAGPASAVALADWLPDTGTHTVQATDAQAPAAIVYTSGTTGRPKGVVLSHGAVLWNAAAASARVPLYANDRLLSFLPLSHTLERTAGYYAPMLCGAEVAFARGIPELAEDLRTLRPTTLVSVPRIFERVERALAQTHARWPESLARLHTKLIERAADAYLASQGHGRRPRGFRLYAPLTRLAGAPLRRRLGGRLRHAVCGGAPLRISTARLFAGAGTPILQGYGLTETAPVLTVNPPHDNRLETVGPALEGVELHRAGNGELLARSPGLMDGYWADAEATAAAIDADGYFHTGDLAEVHDGYWRITGRLKDVLVLANGEKVAPADLEQAIEHDGWIAQALVVGEGRPFLAGLLVLEPAAWQGLATELGLDPADPAALADAGAREAVLHRTDAALAAFPGYARLRAAHLSLEPWTVENDLLTPTLKPRRPEILRRHESAIEALYRGH